MVDEFKSLKDSLLKSVLSAVSGGDSSSETNGNGGKSTFALREVIAALATLAGKGKDEIVQMISREIGNAIAGALKEPIRQAMKDKKLRMTFEFVPSEGAPSTKSSRRSSAKKK